MNKRIDYLIKELGIKQIEFAKRINLSQPYVSALCSGSKTPSDRTILDICREFGVNEAWLRYGEGDMFRTQTKEEELFELFGMMMGDSSREAEFKRRLITVMLRMRPEEWSLLERKARELLEETKKDAP